MAADVHGWSFFKASTSVPTLTNPVDSGSSASSRRDLFALAQVTTAFFLSSSVTSPPSAFAAATLPSGPDDGKLPELPPAAVRSYLQYRVPLQTSADFYVFELQEKLGNVYDWGEIGEYFQANNNRGQGNPNRIEREFTNTFRILGLSMPPDTADELREAQFRFEAAMAKISKATNGIRRDLPVEISNDAIPNALAGWDEGRMALNDFFRILNDTTGLPELRQIPPAGSDQFAKYGRSQRSYVELKKKIKLCQNRGGPTLSNAWGQLMVSGYLQDSCGIPDLDDYFYQT